MPDTIDWHYAANNQQIGPVSTEVLRQLAQSGQLQVTDLVWRAGMTQWQPAGQQPELFNTQPARVVTLPLPPFSPPVAYRNPPADLGDDLGMRLLLPVGRSGWAIAAGYLGLFSFVVLPAPVALIISIIAIRDIKRHPDRHGLGRAYFGLIMGILGTLVLVLSVIVAFLR